jgi:hypothetical protein
MIEIALLAIAAGFLLGPISRWVASEVHLRRLANRAQGRRAAFAAWVSGASLERRWLDPGDEYLLANELRRRDGGVREWSAYVSDAHHLIAEAA